MTDTYPAGGGRGRSTTRPDGHLPTGDAAQDAWNRRHEALAQEIMEATGENPARARQIASLRLRAAGDESPWRKARESRTGQPGASGGVG